MTEIEIEPSEKDSSGKEERKRAEDGKFEKKEPENPEEKEVKTEQRTYEIMVTEKKKNI